MARPGQMLLDACQTVDEAEASVAIIAALNGQLADLERRIHRQEERLEPWARRELVNETARVMRHGTIGFRPDGSFWVAAAPIPK